MAKSVKEKNPTKVKKDKKLKKESKIPKQTKKQVDKIEKIKSQSDGYHPLKGKKVNTPKETPVKAVQKKELGIIDVFKIALEVIFVVTFIFFEELIWERIAKPFGKWLASLKTLQKLQVWIEARGTYETLAIFLIPLAIAEWMGLYSGALILQGSMAWAITLYILKLPVAGLTFWVFSFSKAKLLAIGWFNTLYELLMQLLDWIKSTRIYRKVKYNIYLVKRFIKSMKGEGVFTNEIGHIYQGLKNIINGMRA